PDAYAEAPPHVAAVMTGAMSGLGIYGLLRAMLLVAPELGWSGPVLLLAGGASALLGIVSSLAQGDLKRLLAWSSVENLGLTTLGIGAAIIAARAGQDVFAAMILTGALLHLLHHATFKPLLFLAA